jgi:aspartyl-tRNA(Asn)/glutamyl-tRNA(Gln) amidotransferase subunit C
MPEMDVSYVAYLARLELSATEKQKISAQLKDILSYVAKLNELDVSKVEPTAHATPLTNVLRKDEVRPSVERGRILKNAPNNAHDLFIVPKIVE